jgi:hypothetical protein
MVSDSGALTQFMGKQVYKFREGSLAVYLGMFSFYYCDRFTRCQALKEACCGLCKVAL